MNITKKRLNIDLICSDDVLGVTSLELFSLSFFPNLRIPICTYVGRTYWQCDPVIFHRVWTPGEIEAITYYPMHRLFGEFWSRNGFERSRESKDQLATVKIKAFCRGRIASLKQCKSQHNTVMILPFARVRRGREEDMPTTTADCTSMHLHRPTLHQFEVSTEVNACLVEIKPV